MCKVNLRVAGVTKPLLSVEEMMYKNHRVILALLNSYKENTT